MTYNKLCFECNCGILYELYEEASNCCGDEVWDVYRCAECGKDFDNEAEADACCMSETEETQ